MKHYADEERVSSLLTVLAYDQSSSLFFLEDQTLAFAFLCQPLPGGDESASDRMNILLNNDWPSGTLLQFCLWASPNVTQSTEAFRARRSAYRNDRLLSSYVDAVSDTASEGAYKPLISNSELLTRDIQLLVVWKIPLAASEPTERDMEDSSRLLGATERNLQAVGIQAKRLCRNGYIEIMESILNWSDEPGWKTRRPTADDHTPLKDQIVDYDVGVTPHKDGVEIGNAFVKTLSIKRFPRRAGFGLATTYLGDIFTGSRGIRENCLITASLFFPNAQSTSAKLDRKRYWTINQAYGPLLKFVPQLATKKAGFDALYEAFQDGDRPVRLYLGMALFGRDAEHANAAASNAKTFWSENGFQLIEDRYLHLPCFLNMIPFGADRHAVKELHRYKTMATRHTIGLLPLFGDWKGTGTPDFQLFSRNGQLMNMSLFDSDASYNGVIAAQSGSGKSFLTNELISAYLSQGGQVWAIDVGGSYAKQVEIYEGDMMEFERGREPCLNPFPLVEDFSDEEDILIGLIVAMAAPTEPLKDIQVAELKRVLKSIWGEKGRDMTTDDLAARLIETDDQRVRDVGYQLYPFTSEGEYGRYMIGDNTISFKNRFTVLELEALKGRRHLQQVVLLELVYQIQQTVYRGERDRPKIVIIDEAWDLLSGGNVASFINDAYRRFRKYGAAAVVVLQSIADLYENPVGRAIAENSPNMYLLGQKGESIDSLKQNKRLSLNDAGYTFLKSVHTISGLYSEIFCITDYGSGIGRLIVDPFRKLMYSTHPKDVQQIKEKQQQGMSVTEAIDAILKERAHD